VYVGWLVGWLVSLLVGWLVCYGLLVGCWLVCWLVGQLLIKHDADPEQHTTTTTTTHTLTTTRTTTTANWMTNHSETDNFHHEHQLRRPGSCEQDFPITQPFCKPWAIPQEPTAGSQQVGGEGWQGWAGLQSTWMEVILAVAVLAVV
jgi:hypothetical protein